jgi:hypothetical protein
MTLANGDGALIAAATADLVPQKTPFPLLVDTATALTTFDATTTQAVIAGFVMYGVEPSGATVPRFSIANVPLFQTPLAPVGVGAATVKIGGIIGGDNLSRFVVSLDYRGPAPSVTLQNSLPPCNCELSTQCQSVMGFQLAGGQDTQLQGQTYVVIGNNLYTYPPSRVLLDACLEPLADPLPATDGYARCGTPNGTQCPPPQYMPSGVDIKLVVATGFPGLGLSANAYDRLRGAGAATALFAGATVQLHLGDLADEGASGNGVTAARTTLGRTAKPTAQNHGVSALALVGLEGFYGPCAELARSRRLRRYNFVANQPKANMEGSCLIDTNTQCASAMPLVNACTDVNDKFCGDTNCGHDDSPAAAVLELTKPLDIYVLPDLTPLLVSLNADLRPTQVTIDGVIGTTALARLVTTLDYPNKRLVARCADAASCTGYAEIANSAPTSGCNGCLKSIDPSSVLYDSACAAAP